MRARPSFDQIYMRLAHELAHSSTCIKRQVGAVIARDTRVVSTGYNGPPSGSYNCSEKWPKNGCPRSIRGGCLMALHAEQNAILYALERGIPLKGNTLYVTLSPCLPCARLILSVGIGKVFYTDSYAKMKNIAQDEGLHFLATFGIQSIQLSPLHPPYGNQKK